MHAAPPRSPSDPPIVLPPLAPGYAWSLTAHGWSPVLYTGPPLLPWSDPPAPSEAPGDTGALPPAPALARTNSPPATTTAVPSAPPRPAPPPALDTADPLADLPPAVVALAKHDARVARALVDLADARRVQADTLRTACSALAPCGQLPRDRKQAIAWLVQIGRARPAVAALLLLHQHASTAAQRATRTLIAAMLPHLTPASDPHGPPPTAAAPALPEPPQQAPACGLDAAQLDAAMQLQERDPAVAHALAAHAEAMERAHATAATCAAALDRHGPGPPDPAARAARLHALAARDPVVAVALAAALASVEAAERTAAQLAATLAPYAPRAPPERAQLNA